MKKTIILVLCIIFSALLHAVPAQADETITPATPQFTIVVSEHEDVFTFTIQKTADADGYRICAKEPGSKKYRIIATIKKNGKTERTYTYSPFNLGKYSFKIKAYHKNGGKKIWSKASAVVKVNVKNDIFSRVPVGIRFAAETQTEFRCGGNDIGENEDNPYRFEYECDEKFKDAEIRKPRQPHGRQAVSITS